MSRPSKGARDRWIHRTLAARVLRHGGIVYRGVDQVKKWASVTELKSEVQARGYHLLQIGDYYVVVGHDPARVEVLC